MKRLVLLIALLLIASPASAQMGLTMHGVPDFCASPTKTSTATGNWNAGGTWVGGVAPTTDDVVAIVGTHVVTYNVNSAAHIKAICVHSGATLTFGTSGSLALSVGTLVVEDDGILTAGDFDTSTQFTGSLVITFVDDYFAGYSTNTGDLDPAQWNTGLIGAGKIRLYGTAKTTCVRISPPSASATTITLQSTPTGWNSGDDVAIPESQERSYAGSSPGPYFNEGTPTPLDDRRTLTANVTTTSASLSSGLTYAHPGGEDSSDTVAAYPLMCDLSASTITLTSESPSGTRGHTIYLYRADVDIRNTLFKDLGRTTVSDLNCSLRTTGTVDDVANCTEGTGAWTRVGTNQKGRYAVHFHHLYGPVNGSNTGYQFKFVGNRIIDAKKWPLTLHNASYGFVQGNLIMYYQGPAIMGEDGGEHYNLIDQNVMCISFSTVAARGFDGPGSTGSGGRETAGLWMNSGANNYVTDNVACAMHNLGGNIVNEVGFKFHQAAASTNADGFSNARMPNFRGADMTDADEYTVINPKNIGLLQFEGNECYAMSTCFTSWELNTNGVTPQATYNRSYIDDMVCWNIWSECVYSYQNAGVTVRRLTMYGIRSRLRAGELADKPFAVALGDYEFYDGQLVDSALHNTGCAAFLMADDGGFTISNTTNKGLCGVWIAGTAAPGSSAFPYGWGGTADPGTAIRTINLNDFSHTTVSGVTALSIYQTYTVSLQGGDDRFYPYLPYVVNVNDHNGTTSDFRVYFHEQIASNVAGGLAPCSDESTHPDVNGPTCTATNTIPGDPVAYYDFTGSAKVAPAKMHSLINAGVAPDVEFGVNMTQSDITSAGALIEGGASAGAVQKYLKVTSDASLPFPVNEKGTVFIKFKPTSTTMGAYRTYHLVRVGGNTALYHAYALGDVDIYPIARQSGGGGSQPELTGQQLSHASGAEWGLFVTYDWKLDSGDTGNECIRVLGLTSDCLVVDEVIASAVGDPMITHIGFNNDAGHPGENVGDDGNVELFAIFPTQLTDSEMAAFEAWLDGEESPPGAAGRKPRRLGPLRRIR